MDLAVCAVYHTLIYLHLPSLFLVYWLWEREKDQSRQGVSEGSVSCKPTGPFCGHVQ